MKEMVKMMLELQRYCARNNIKVPASVEIRFETEGQARHFGECLKADFRHGSATLTPDLTAIEKIDGMTVFLAYEDHEGKQVRL